MNKQTTTGRTFNLGSVRVAQVDVEPCFRLIAIGKGLRQYCKCSACARRGDLGKLILPR